MRLVSIYLLTAKHNQSHQFSYYVSSELAAAVLFGTDAAHKSPWWVRAALRLSPSGVTSTGKTLTRRHVAR